MELQGFFIQKMGQGRQRRSKKQPIRRLAAVFEGYFGQNKYQIGF